MKVVRMILRPIELLLSYLAVQTAPRRQISGFVVTCSSVETECELFFRQCVAALELIRNFDPSLFGQVRRDVKAIALTTRGFSYYEPVLRTIFLDVDAITREPEYLACVLVHEAAHARLYWSGVRNYSAHAEGHERMCVAEEIAFASRLPDSDKLVEQLGRTLERPWWNEAGHRDCVRRVARRHNLPDWLERLLLRIGTR
jgi:hypothetical protein